MLQLERLLPNRGQAWAAATSRKIVVIDGNPDSGKDPFCGALCDAYEDGAWAGGWKVERLDASTFESAEALAKIRWAHHISVVFPLCDDKPPAALRSLFERYAFLETLDTFAPVEHSVRSVILMEMPAFAHRALLRTDNNLSILRRSISLPGIAADNQLFIGGIDAISADQRNTWLKTVRALGLRGV